MEKNIGFLITDFNGKGGTERVTSIIANGLKKREYKIYIISCRNGKNPCYTVDSDVELLSLQGEKIHNAISRKWNSFFSLKQYVRKYHIDIMIAVDVMLYLYLFPLQQTEKCRCIAWEHFNYYDSDKIIYREIRKFVAKNADKLVVLGKNDLNNYRKEVGKTINAQYIYNPLPIELTNTYKGASSHKIISVGRLETQKGFDRLIEVWKLLENRFPEWELDIVGEGSQRMVLENKIKQYGLTRIFLKKFSNSILEEYDKAAIYALPSRYEGFVLVLLEAQARRLPCVSFDIKEGPREIISDGVNGFLVEDGNIEQFADKLRQLMIDTQLREKFSTMTQKDLARFETERVVGQWENLIEEFF